MKQSKKLFAILLVSMGALAVGCQSNAPAENAPAQETVTPAEGQETSAEAPTEENTEAEAPAEENAEVAVDAQ